MTNDLIYLISEDYCRQNLPIEWNFDMQFFYKSIEDTQKLYVEPTLGTHTYNYLLSIVDDGSITGDTVYTNLLKNYIQPMLVNYTMLQAIPLIHFKMSNKSINKLNSTNSETSALEEIKYLQDYYINIAEMYRERLRLHLIANNALYPELYTANTIDDISPSKDDYTCDMVFDGFGC